MPFNLEVFIMLSFLTSFIITALLGKIIVPALRKFKIKQTILECGPSWHKSKEGTPTMGGVVFILGILLTILIFIPVYYFGYLKNLTDNNSIFNITYLKLNTLRIVCGVLMAISFGIIGFWDDYIKVTKKQNLGLTAKQKLLLQFFVAFLYLFSKSFIELQFGVKNITTVYLPFFNEVNFGVFYYLISSIFIVGTVNAVNITDGIDGLNTSVTFMASIFLFLFACFFRFKVLSILISALLGSCIGFFIWNRHPAKIFMGDTGSLFLGGLLCAVVFSMGLPVILILVGAIYYVEMFSVILQVLYFKMTKGKRLFKMAPIHHHFELLKWSERKICIAFSLFTVFCGILTIIFSLFLKRV